MMKKDFILKIKSINKLINLLLTDHPKNQHFPPNNLIINNCKKLKIITCRIYFMKKFIKHLNKIHKAFSYKAEFKHLVLIKGKLKASAPNR